MQLSHYLGLVLAGEKKLAEAFEKVSKQHALETDILQTCKKLASWSLDHVENLKKLADRYGLEKDDEANDLYSALFETRTGSLGLIRDLHALWVMAGEVEMGYIILLQAAQALRDRELELGCRQFGTQTFKQKSWLHTRIENSASQALVAADS